MFQTNESRAAESFTDVVMLVGVSTLAGGILGASTLPFHSEPGNHVDNLYIGAAIGAVIGVGIAAWSGVSDSENYDYGDEYEQGEPAPPGNDYGKKPANPALILANLDHPKLVKMPRVLGVYQGAVQSRALFWTPLASVKFSF